VKTRDWQWPRRGLHSPPADGDTTLTYEDIWPDTDALAARDLAQIVPPIEVIQVPAADEITAALAHVRGGFVVREKVQPLRGTNAQDDIAREGS